MDTIHELGKMHVSESAEQPYQGERQKEIGREEHKAKKKSNGISCEPTWPKEQGRRLKINMPRA